MGSSVGSDSVASYQCYAIKCIGPRALLPSARRLSARPLLRPAASRRSDSFCLSRSRRSLSRCVCAATGALEPFPFAAGLVLCLSSSASEEPSARGASVSGDPEPDLVFCLLICSRALQTSLVADTSVQGRLHLLFAVLFSSTFAPTLTVVCCNCPVDRLAFLNCLLQHLLLFKVSSAVHC